MEDDKLLLGVLGFSNLSWVFRVSGFGPKHEVSCNRGQG
jgi:hypothetical protein